MKINWTELGFGIAQLIPLLVKKVQKVKGDAPGAEKKTDVLDLAKLILGGTEMIAGNDLIDDAEVIEATSHYIDATVALKNAVASARARREASHPNP